MNIEDLITTSFSSQLRSLVSEDKDKYLAMASLVDVGEFIPDIDTEANVDLLPIAFNAFVVNRANKNGDVIDTQTALAIYKDFANKPINLEHNRKNIIGVILNAGFSEFGTDKPITEDQAKDMTGPFNVVLGGVMWRIADRDLAAKIEESSDPQSEDYGLVSASWELGFSDYNVIKVAEGSKNIEDGEVIAEEIQVEEIKKYLKGFGGSGKFGEYNVYRQPVGQVIPLGIGLTENPAAEVQGVATSKTVENKEVEQNISQSSENNVIEHNDSNQKKDVVMTISKIEDITDEALQELSASAITEFISEEIKKASVQFDSEKKEVQNALEIAESQFKSLSEDFESSKQEMADLKDKLAQFEAAQAEAEKLEKFNERMSVLDTAYNLSDEVREVIAKQLLEVESDEQFESWSASMKVFLSPFEKREEQEEVQAEEQEETVAEVVEEAIENGEEQQVALANSMEGQAPKSKWEGALKVEDLILS